jgi:hypothetical protein
MRSSSAGQLKINQRYHPRHNPLIIFAYQHKFIPIASSSILPGVGETQLLIIIITLCVNRRRSKRRLHLKYEQCMCQPRPNVCDTLMQT